MTINLSEATIKQLDFIDRCRETFSINDVAHLKLPQIVAAGDQSSGKSSILEAISGIKLPKGVDTVTKRPIVVQMRRRETLEINIKCGGREYKLTNESEVEGKIRSIQGDTVVRDPIFIDVFAPTVPPLTIVDLPGVVQQALRGQKAEIVADTRAVTEHYTNQSNSLILAVIQANVDFNTIGILNIAMESDSDSSRTIGVLTKLDRVAAEDRDSVKQILDNVKRPLQKGYYGLVLSDSVMKAEGGARAEEELREFMQMGTIWTNCEENLGLRRLTKKLVEELAALTNGCLPALREKMAQYLVSTNKELDDLGVDLFSEQSKRKYLIEVKDEILSKVNSALVKGACKLHAYPQCKTFLTRSNIIGIHPTEDEHDTFLYGQHQIFSALLFQYTKYYKDNFKLPSAKYTVKYLQNLSERCSTEHIPIFLSSEPFKEIVNLHLNKYRDLSLDCISKCRQLSETFIKDMIGDIKSWRDNLLKDAFQGQCLEQLDKQVQIAEGHINVLFKSEVRCFTQRALGGCARGDSSRDTAVDASQTVPSIEPHQQIQGVSKAALNRMSGSTSMILPSPAAQRETTDRDEPKVVSNGKRLKDTLEEYIEHMIQRLGDVVPNFIMLSLFDEFHSKLQESLNGFVTCDDIVEYFKPTPAVDAQIKELRKRQENLQESLEELRKLL